MLRSGTAPHTCKPLFTIIEARNRDIPRINSFVFAPEHPSVPRDLIYDFHQPLVDSFLSFFFFCTCANHCYFVAITQSFSTDGLLEEIDENKLAIERLRIFEDSKIGL